MSETVVIVLWVLCAVCAVAFFGSLILDDFIVLKGNAETVIPVVGTVGFLLGTVLMFLACVGSAIVWDGMWAVAAILPGCILVAIADDGIHK